MAVKWWQDKTHPIWKMAQTATTGMIIMLIFAGAQFATSTNFDTNEIQALGLSGGSLAVIAALRKMLG